MVIDFTNLSDDEFIDLIRQVDNEKQARIARLKDDVLNVAEKFGCSIDIDSIIVKPKRKRLVPAKYRNPDNSSQTWSGRGIPPRWLMDIEQNGGSRQDMIVQPELDM